MPCLVSKCDDVDAVQRAGRAARRCRRSCRRRASRSRRRRGTPPRLPARSCAPCWRSRHHAGFAQVGQVGDVVVRLRGAEGDVEERAAPGAAPPGCVSVGGRLRLRELRWRRRPTGRRRRRSSTSRCPGSTRRAARGSRTGAARRRSHRRRGSDRRAGRRVAHHGGRAVPGEEELRRARSRWPRRGSAAGPASRRSRSSPPASSGSITVLSVSRNAVDPADGLTRSSTRSAALLRVARLRRIAVGAVRLREGVVARALVARVAAVARAVVVVQEVLVEELAVAVGGRAGDQDRRGAPLAGVLELRGARRVGVEDVRAGPRAGAVVQRRRARGRGRGGDRRDSAQRCQRGLPLPHRRAMLRGGYGRSVSVCSAGCATGFVRPAIQPSTRSS